MSRREAFVAAALAQVGTKFHHQGRAAGVGLDCIGLVVCAARLVGWRVTDRTDYGRRPDGRALIEGLRAHGGVEVEVEEIEAGDILVFRYDGQPQHVAVALGDGRMVHAFAPAGRVVETEIGLYWRRRLVAVYRMPLD